MKRIFLAEDDGDDQEIFQIIITEQDEDIDLKIMENGEDLLQKIESTPTDQLPHLIILDQNMPRLNGYDTIQLLRANPKYKDIPMVIYSTYRDGKFYEKCQSENIPFHEKPDTFDGLRKLLNEILKTI